MESVRSSEMQSVPCNKMHSVRWNAMQMMSRVACRIHRPHPRLHVEAACTNLRSFFTASTSETTPNTAFSLSAGQEGEREGGREREGEVGRDGRRVGGWVGVRVPE